jgi:His-Xaa-Ser system protein HxsD
MMIDTSERMAWIKQVSDKSMMLEIDIRIYSLEALFRVCYAYTDRCYLFLAPATPEAVTVRITGKKPDADHNTIAGEFSTALIDERVRRDIAAETMTIRELIVAQAFAEADIIDGTCSEDSYIDDPKGIAV